MITLATILFIWFIISWYKIAKKSKEEGEVFSPNYADPIYAFGFFLGLVIFTSVLVVSIATYLP